VENSALSQAVIVAELSRIYFTARQLLMNARVKSRKKARLQKGLKEKEVRERVDQQSRRAKRRRNGSELPGLIPRYVDFVFCRYKMLYSQNEKNTTEFA